MTGIAQPSPEPIFSTRTPHLPFAVLIGAAVVILVVLRALNTDAPAHPLSGAPVEAADAPPVAVAEPAPRVPATGSISIIVPTGTDAGPIRVGPAAVPPDGRLALTAVLPSAEQTFITIAPSRVADDGSLVAAAPAHVMVVPAEDGRATLEASAAELTEELGAGLYRVRVIWQGELLGRTDVALGVMQPSGIAIFDEPRQVSFAAGEHIGLKYDASGQPSGQLPYALRADSSATAIAYGRFGGRPHVLIDAGVWSGHWIPLSEVVTLR